MKTLKEIENLSLEELEQKAAECNAPVPEGLERRLREILAARELADEARERRTHWIPYASLAVAAAAAVLLFLPQRGPKDTFDDPQLAYAEVERTFRIISGKMSAGMDIVREAGATAEMPYETIHKIQSK